MYARAVWIEDGRETEGTIPSNWVNHSQKTIRWPNDTKTAGKAYRKKMDPQDEWLTYPLVKIKMTSGKYCG